MPVLTSDRGPNMPFLGLSQRCALVLIPWFGDQVFREREAVRGSRRSPRQPPPASRINLYEHRYQSPICSHSQLNSDFFNRLRSSRKFARKVANSTHLGDVLFVTSMLRCPALRSAGQGFERIFSLPL